MTLVKAIMPTPYLAKTSPAHPRKGRGLNRHGETESAVAKAQRMRVERQAALRRRFEAAETPNSFAAV